jgi:hypothetical protein
MDTNNGLVLIGDHYQGKTNHQGHEEHKNFSFLRGLDGSKIRRSQGGCVFPASPTFAAATYAHLNYIIRCCSSMIQK